MPRNIVFRQRINESKYLEAKILRRNMTPAEKRLWERLRKNRANGHHFRRQQIIAGFIVDFYCHKASLIIELDGAVHNQNRESNIQRDTILQALGFRIVRFWNEEVIMDIEKVMAEIERFCATDLTQPYLPFIPPPPLPLREGEEGAGGGEVRSEKTV